MRLERAGHLRLQVRPLREDEGLRRRVVGAEAPHQRREGVQLRPANEGGPFLMNDSPSMTPVQFFIVCNVVIYCLPQSVAHVLGTLWAVDAESQDATPTWSTTPDH